MDGPTPVTIVVPCCNEEPAIASLAEKLARVEADFRHRFDVKFLFVDDGSTDDTWNKLVRRFGDKPHCFLVRHERNFGVAAAILTGIRQADTEVVCSMDSDCTYDPLALAEMIPLLAEDVDLVTASPYHPQGRVENVPGWRLAASRWASWCYRLVLRQRLHTYTSCFRVYRRSAFADLELAHPGFAGVAEMLGRADLQGSRIVEHPATLAVRTVGRSKLRFLKAVGGHMRLLVRLLYLRMFHSKPLAPRAAHSQPQQD